LHDAGLKAGITIRMAGSDDCAAIGALAAQLGYQSFAEQIAQRLRYFSPSNERNLLVAGMPSGEIVGWIGMYVVRTISSDARLEISGLVVDEKHRSHKVGALLLKRAEEWGAARGLNEVSVHANAIRERAHRFYEQHGYHLEKTQKVFRKALGGGHEKC
jgi:GNAT superfamily N-acetyltransferase